MTQHDAVSPADVGRRVGLSPDTIVREIEAHHLDAFRSPGGHYRILRTEADRYVLEMTGGHNPANAANPHK